MKVLPKTHFSHQVKMIHFLHKMITNTFQNIVHLIHLINHKFRIRRILIKITILNNN